MPKGPHLSCAADEGLHLLGFQVLREPVAGRCKVPVSRSLHSPALWGQDTVAFHTWTGVTARPPCKLSPHFLSTYPSGQETQPHCKCPLLILDEDLLASDDCATG